MPCARAAAHTARRPSASPRPARGGCRAAACAPGACRPRPRRENTPRPRAPRAAPPRSARRLRTRRPRWSRRAASAARLLVLRGGGGFPWASRYVLERIGDIRPQWLSQARESARTPRSARSSSASTTRSRGTLRGVTPPGSPLGSESAVAAAPVAARNRRRSRSEPGLIPTQPIAGSSPPRFGVMERAADVAHLTLTGRVGAHVERLLSESLPVRYGGVKRPSRDGRNWPTAAFWGWRREAALRRSAHFPHCPLSANMGNRRSRPPAVIEAAALESS